MNRNVQHVIPRNGEWAVKGEGNEKLTKIFQSKMAAIAYAYDIADNTGAYLAIHNKKGEIKRFKATRETHKLVEMMMH